LTQRDRSPHVDSSRSTTPDEVHVIELDAHVV
jgi:hypothetical protein